uniref:Chitin-binding type-2 domain-containing protein n=1 Tax=Strongyloides venezuelensis TaxID=75913 RepID=A0A0K0G4N8_STRVS
MSDKDNFLDYDDEKDQKEQFSFFGSELTNPIWMVTRRQHTEVSPVRVRDADTYEIVSSPYHTRSVTTTERVHIMQTPLNIDIEDINEDLITSLSPTGNATKTVYSTTSTHLEGPKQIHGGITTSGVPLHLGVQVQPESRQTTTVITTTTTTYRVVESSEDVPMETDEDIISPMTIDLQFLRAMASPQSIHVKTDILISPKSNEKLEIETSDYNLSPKDHSYVIVNKTENSNPVSPSSEKTKLVFEYIPYDAKYPEPIKYTGPITITEKKDDLQTLPIRHHVQIYHPTGQSDIPVELENIDKIGEKRFQKSNIFKNIFKKGGSTKNSNQIPENSERISTNNSTKNLDEMDLDDEGNLTTHQEIKMLEKKEENNRKNIGYKLSHLFKKSNNKDGHPHEEKVVDDTIHLSIKNKLNNPKANLQLKDYSESLNTDHLLKKTEKTITALKNDVDDLEYKNEKINKRNSNKLEKKIDLLEEPIEFYVYIYHPGWYDNIKNEKRKTNKINDEDNTLKHKYDKNVNEQYKNDNSGNSFDEEDYEIVENDEVDIDDINDFEKIDNQNDSEIDKNTQIFISNKNNKNGHYDENKTIQQNDYHIQPTNLKVTKDTRNKQSLLEKGKHLKDDIFGMFQKKYQDYPTSEPYTGELDQTKPSSELSGIPLEQHVEKIPSGYYDKLIQKEETIVIDDEKEPKESLLEKGKHLKDDIFGMFQKKYQDYPTSEPYTGEIDSTSKRNELDQEPLNSYVSPYDVGYYTNDSKVKSVPIITKKEFNDRPYNVEISSDVYKLRSSNEQCNVDSILLTQNNQPISSLNLNDHENILTNKEENNYSENVEIESMPIEPRLLDNKIYHKKKHLSVYLTTPIGDFKSFDVRKKKNIDNSKTIKNIADKSLQSTHQESYIFTEPKHSDNVMKITDSFISFQNLHQSKESEKNKEFINNNMVSNLKFSSYHNSKGRSVSSPSKRHVEFMSTYTDSIPLTKSPTNEITETHISNPYKSKPQGISIDPKSLKIVSKDDSPILPSEQSSHYDTSISSTSVIKNQSDISYSYLLPTTVEYSNLHNNLNPSRPLSPSFEVYLRKYDAKMRNRELVNIKPFASSTPIRNIQNGNVYNLPSTDNTSFKKFVETYDRGSSENKHRRHKGWTTITQTTTITYSKRLNSTINRNGQNQTTAIENVVINNLNSPYDNKNYIDSVETGKAIHDHITGSPPRVFERDENKRDIMLQTDPSLKGPLNHPINYSRLFHRSRSESRPQYFVTNNKFNNNRNGRSIERYPESSLIVPENHQIKRRFEYEQAVRNSPIELSGDSNFKTRASTEPLYSMERIQRYDLDFPSSIPPPNSLHYQNSDLPPIEEIGKTSFEQRYSFTTDVPNDNDFKTETDNSRTANVPLKRARTNVKHYCNVI